MLDILLLFLIILCQIVVYEGIEGSMRIGPDNHEPLSLGSWTKYF